MRDSRDRGAYSFLSPRFRRTPRQWIAASIAISKAGLRMTVALYAARLAEFADRGLEIRPGVIRADMISAVESVSRRRSPTDCCRSGGWACRPTSLMRSAPVPCGHRLSTGQVLNIDGGFPPAHSLMYGFSPLSCFAALTARATIPVSIEHRPSPWLRAVMKWIDGLRWYRHSHSPELAHSRREHRVRKCSAGPGMPIGRDIVKRFGRAP